jgi:hypothetical protein
MQASYLNRLGAPVQDVVRELEQRANIDIQVLSDPRLNRGGPLGQGHLEVLVEERRNLIFAPTNGCFPDGAVRHVLLHVKRFHFDGAPKLKVAARRRGGISPDAMGHLDNAIEQIAIVPWELRLHPERREHSVAVLQGVCSSLSDVPRVELILPSCMLWSFLRHVLSGSTPTETARRFAVEHGLLEVADRFADQVLAAPIKEAAVQLLFATFPEMNKDLAALEYISSRTGAIQRPIP